MPLSASQRLAPMDGAKLGRVSGWTSAAGAVVLRLCKAACSNARRKGAVWHPDWPEAQPSLGPHGRAL